MQDSHCVSLALSHAEEGVCSITGVRPAPTVCRGRNSSVCGCTIVIIAAIVQGRAVKSCAAGIT